MFRVRIREFAFTTAVREMKRPDMICPAIAKPTVPDQPRIVARDLVGNTKPNQDLEIRLCKNKGK